MSAKPAPYPADTRAKGWRFELDHERIRQSDTWALAPADVRPWLLMLWMVAWEQAPCGSLPAEDELIAARIGMSPKTLAKHRAVLLRGWWTAADGRLYHDTLIARVLEMIESRGKNAKRVADWKAAHRDQRGGNALPTGEQPARNDTGTGTGTNTEANASVAAKSPRSTKKCPAAFAPTSPQEWIAGNCPGLDWQRETEKFRDYTFATARTDWMGTWKNWMRKAHEDASRPRQTMSFRERDAQVAAARIHEMTGGLVSAKPPSTRRNDALQEVFDAAPRLVG